MFCGSPCNLPLLLFPGESFACACTHGGRGKSLSVLFPVTVSLCIADGFRTAGEVDAEVFSRPPSGLRCVPEEDRALGNVLLLSEKAHRWLLVGPTLLLLCLMNLFGLKGTHSVAIMMICILKYIPMDELKILVSSRSKSVSFFMPRQLCLFCLGKRKCLFSSSCCTMI